MPSKMELLLEKRRSLFGRIRRTIENLNKLGKEKTDFSAVETRLKTLESNYCKFLANHDAILELTTEEDAKREYFAQDVESCAEEKYLSAKGLLKSLLLELQPNGLGTSRSSTGASSVQRKPPAIELPRFSGIFNDWLEFKDLFTAIIASFGNLSEVEKLHYLKISVADDPAHLLKNLPTRAENYEVAWDTLISHYENPRLLVNDQLGTLTSLPGLTRESALDLKKLFTSIKEVIAALAAMQRPITKTDDLLVFLTVQRLDPVTRRDRELLIGSKKEPPTWKELAEFLESRISSLNASESSSSKHSGSQPPATTRPARVHQASERPQTCALCSGEHFIVYCDQYNSMAAEHRRDVVTTKKLCFNCLGNHQISACRSEKRCRLCDGRHHTTIHEAVSTPSSQVSALPLRHGKSAEVAPARPTASSTAHTSQVRATGAPLTLKRIPVLLATALVEIANANGKLIEARALIDQGAKTSFISDNLTLRLHLPRLRTSTTIYGIGGRKTQDVRGQVSFRVSSRFDHQHTYKVDAFVLPTLTAYTPLHNDVQQEWPHLEGLQLADPYYDNYTPIDLILGAGPYSQILQEGLRKGPEGAPIAQRTTLGWILSGYYAAAATSSTLGITSATCSHGGLLTRHRIYSQHRQADPPGRAASLLESAFRPATTGRCSFGSQRGGRNVADF